jgi:hypothetical protein
MIKALGVLLLVALAGCSGIPQFQHTVSPCAADEASYACQVERYQNVNAE